MLDRLLSEKPNATYIALKSLLLYSQNQTSEWLHSKTEEEKKRLFSAARKLTSVHRANFRKRREDIEQKRLEVQQVRDLERQRKHEKEVRDKEELTKQLAPLSLWTTTTEIEKGLEVLKTSKEKQEALKVQISFRRKVFTRTKLSSFFHTKGKPCH